MGQLSKEDKPKTWVHMREFLFSLEMRVSSIGDRLEPLIRQATRLIEIEVNSGCSHAECVFLSQCCSMDIMNFTGVVHH